MKIQNRNTEIKELCVLKANNLVDIDVAILKKFGKMQEYIVAYDYKGPEQTLKDECTWSQGHYFSDYQDAVNYLNSNYRDKFQQESNPLVIEKTNRGYLASRTIKETGYRLSFTDDITEALIFPKGEAEQYHSGGYKVQYKPELIVVSAANTRARHPGQGLEPKKQSRSRENSLQM